MKPKPTPPPVILGGKASGWGKVCFAVMGRKVARELGREPGCVFVQFVLLCFCNACLSSSLNKIDY